MDRETLRIEELRQRLISHGDVSVQERNWLCDMALRARAEGEAEHVAWCRYVRNGNHPVRILTCDSDDEGAFKVYRHPLPSGMRLVPEEASWMPKLTDAMLEAARQAMFVDVPRKDAYPIIRNGWRAMLKVAAAPEGK